MFVSVFVPAGTQGTREKKTTTTLEPHQCQINIAGGEGGGVGMQCQIQVISVFLQTQAVWQLVILAARIYERRFSHHRALVPRTITAE